MRHSASKGIRELVYTALASALIAVSAFIIIPLPSPVAITLQSFGVYFAIFFLGGRLGTLAVALYIAIGAVGLPVFSGFTGGIGRLLDAGGGFIFGFLLAALAYWLMTVLLGERLRFLFAALSHLILYTVGALWYSLVYLGAGEAELSAVLLTCVFPFVIPDAIKLFLAAFVAKRLERIVKFRK